MHFLTYIFMSANTFKWKSIKNNSVSLKIELKIIPQMNLNRRNRTHLAMVYSPGCVVNMVYSPGCVVNMVLLAFPVKLLQVIICKCFVRKLYTWCKQPINLLFRAIHLLTKNKLIFSEQYILFVRNCENIISQTVKHD